jgi:hypothetical protein
LRGYSSKATKWVDFVKAGSTIREPCPKENFILPSRARQGGVSEKNRGLSWITISDVSQPIDSIGFVLFWLGWVETPHAFLHIGMEVDGWDAIEAAHMALGPGGFQAAIGCGVYRVEVEMEKCRA